MKTEAESATAFMQKYVLDGTPARVVERYARLSDLAKTLDFGRFMDNVVVLDTETTGLSYSRDELTQIAAARITKGEISDWFITFVNPGKPIPEEITHLTNIAQSDVENAPSPNDALAQLADFVGDAICVAHNAGFDRTFSTKHPGGYPLLENVWVDSLDLARIALPRLKSHRLIDLVTAFNAPLSTHRADADVEATCAIWPILLAAVHEMPAELLAQIAAFATPEEWPTQVVFDFMQGQTSPRAQGEDAPKTLSLRTLRKQAVGNLNFAAKIDAEILAQDPSRGIIAPTHEEVKEAFSADGAIGCLFDSYEQRAEQVAMSCAVCDSFARSENLVVEAGTGVGKSLAYLLPATLLARKNGISVGVATKTNALLDQLVYHELPLLAQAYPGLTYAPLKGITHYPCLRRIENIVRSGNFKRKLGDNDTTCAAALGALLSYIEQSDYDDIDALKIDYRVLPRRSITCNSQECLRKKCPFFGAMCFGHGSRRFAEAADIVVTNHSLLFCDLAADGMLLPTIRHWVVDEAHGAEQEARRAFSHVLSTEELLRIAAMVSAAESSRNVFVRAQRSVAQLVTDSEDTLLYALTNKALSAGRTFDEAAQAYGTTVKELLFFDTERNKSYEFVDLWVNNEMRAGSHFAAVSEAAALVATAAEALIKASQELVVYLDDYEQVAALQREIAVIAVTLKGVVEAIEVLFSSASDCFAYAAKLSHKKDRLNDELQAMPVNVGSALEETLFERTHSVVFSSATLAVGESFHAFEASLGLNQGEQTRAATLQLASCFDFDSNMIIYVPNDIPEPNERGYLAAMQRLLTETHLAQHGSMLTLFTNRREMEDCYNAVYPKLRDNDLRLVCQKKGVSVKGLRDEYLSDEHLSLFALKSFWEGFDAPGATLRGVIIPKLPFARPTDPLSRERETRDSEAWAHYVLPAAVIEMKQAAGRLIRKSTDEGVLILADKRLLTKNYGRTFLNSMPSRNIRVLSCKEIAEDIARAYAATHPACNADARTTRADG